MIRPTQGLSVALAALLAFGAPALADNHGDASGSSSGTSAGQASQMDRSSDMTQDDGQDDGQSQMQRSEERDDAQESRQASDDAMDGESMDQSTDQGMDQGSGMAAEGGDFDQETLQAFVDAAQQIRVVAAGYQPQIAEADTVEERAALQRAAQNEMRAIVRETEGIDAETYARIVSAAREDRALFERIAEMIAEG